jgi:MFS family permease
MLVPPLLPRGTFRLARGLPTTIALRGILAGAYFGAEVFIPLALVEQRGLSISLAGAALSVAAVGWFLGSFLQSRIPMHVDRARVAVIGCCLVTLGLLLLPLVLIDAVPVWWVAVAVGIESVGMGMVYPTLSVIMLRESLPEEQGFNSSALQFSDALASVVAAGAAGAIHAAAVVSGEVTTWTFTTMWLMTAALALAGVLAAPRLAVLHRRA